MPIIARTNIKEHRDSFSCEKFNFRLHHNITFYVYVSNFSWPIKIQVSGSTREGSTVWFVRRMKDNDSRTDVLHHLNSLVNRKTNRLIILIDSSLFYSF